MKLIEWINLYCFGTMFPMYLCAVGIVIFVLLGGTLFSNPRRTVAGLFRKQDAAADYSAARAMCLALAGTLGVGNIIGVAIALKLGGSGAIFWMWVSALATMLLKYCEIVLSIDCQKQTGSGTTAVLYGGPMYYIQKRWGRAFGGIFCVLCIFASFCGNFVQMRAVSEAAREIFSLPLSLVGPVIFLGIAALVFGGRRRISTFTAWAIPLCTVFYILLCGVLLCLMRVRIKGAFCSVFRGAFSVRSAASGSTGFLCLRAVRHGIAKGVYSHEAGCGTAPISYAGTKRQQLLCSGFMGIAEVFVDTLLLCTLTALVLLCVYPGGMPSGSSLLSVCGAFSKVLGPWASYAVAAMIVLFAFSTVVCWSFYGAECIRYFSKNKRIAELYLFLFAALGGFAVFLDTAFVWELSDFFTVLMTLLNTSCILTYLPQIQKITKAALIPPKCRNAENTGTHGVSFPPSSLPLSHSLPKNGSTRQG